MNFTKPPLATNDKANIVGKKGLLLWRVRSPRCRRSCCCRLSCTRILRDLCRSKGVEIAEKVAGVVRAAWSGAAGGGDGEMVLIEGSIHNRLFRLRL